MLRVIFTTSEYSWRYILSLSFAKKDPDVGCKSQLLVNGNHSLFIKGGGLLYLECWSNGLMNG